MEFEVTISVQKSSSPKLFTLTSGKHFRITVMLVLFIKITTARQLKKAVNLRFKLRDNRNLHNVK